MGNAQVHPMPIEILRLPGGLLRMRVRVNERFKPLLRSLGGRLTDRCRSMNVRGDCVRIGKVVRRRAAAGRMFCERIGGEFQTVDMEHRGGILDDGRTRKR